MSTALSKTAHSSRITSMLTKDQFTKAVAVKVKTARKQANLNQEELAYRAHLYRTYIGHIENGAYSPSFYVIYKIAKALKIPADKLLPS